MKFGVRECANVVFRAKKAGRLGTMEYKKNQPVLYIDTATTSTVEQATSTVYAQGGRGNARLIAWEGDKTVTFTVTDALLSPIGLSILSGAHLLPKKGDSRKVNFHMTSMAEMDASGKIDLSAVVGDNEISDNEYVFVLETDDDGSIVGAVDGAVTLGEDKKSLTVAGVKTAATVMVDYYIVKSIADTNEIHITADTFAGNWYVEADTLFRQQATGVDLPAMLTFPNVKIQSNFSFSMAGTGDPSTFDFTMDAFPDYTLFDKKHKVICAIQVLNDGFDANDDCDTVFLADQGE